MKFSTSNLKWFFFIILVFLSFDNSISAQDIEKKIDIVYVTRGNWQGKLDLYVPDRNPQKSLVIYIHGGGWTHGRKENEYEKIEVFIKNGFAVANVEYRLAQQAPAPAAVEDVNCAITYLLENASHYGFDKNKVVLMGGSAGAHLALLVGLINDRKAFPDTCNLKSFKAAAIISKYGPTDLLTWKQATQESSASSAWIGNRTKDTSFLKSLSPFYQQPFQKIPVLFVHGSQDPTVPLDQSVKLYDKLKGLNYPTELYVVQNGRHGNFPKEETERINAKMISFLFEHLK